MRIAEGSTGHSLDQSRPTRTRGSTRTGRRLTRVWVLVCAAALVLSAGCSGGVERGRETKEAVVQAYLTALQAKDSKALLALVSPQVDAQADVTRVIQADGGKPLKEVEVSYRDDFGGIYVVATVTGRVATGDSPFQTMIPISRVGDRCYLALGQAPPTGSEADTASPSP